MAKKFAHIFERGDDMILMRRQYIDPPVIDLADDDAVDDEPHLPDVVTFETRSRGEAELSIEFKISFKSEEGADAGFAKFLDNPDIAWRMVDQCPGIDA